MTPLSNGDVTLYMQRKAANVTSWSRVVLRGVTCRQKSVRSSDGSQGGAGTLKLVRQTTLVIDADISADTGNADGRGDDCMFVQPKAFLNADTVAGLWTLKKGDVIVLGADTQAIQSTSDLSELQRTNDSYSVIQVVEDATADSPLPCWKVDAL